MIEFLSAAVIGSIICVTYVISHSRAVYSRSFNMSLMMFTIISSLSMFILSQNIVLAIGALSIVRYRNVLKDHRDMLFLLWSVGAGICCGIEEYVVAGTGSLAVFIITIIYGSLHDYDRHLLIIRGNGNLENFIMETINKNFKGEIKLKFNNSNDSCTEVIYEMSKSNSKEVDITCKKVKEELYKIEGIKNINIVKQIEEMGL